MMQQSPAGRFESDRTASSDAAPIQADAAHWLLCRVGTLLCALPVDQVGLTMRLLPIEPVAGAPPYLRGLAIIRGMPVPVVDVGLVVGGALTQPQRLVTMRAAPRTVALAVDEVIGVMAIAAAAAEPLPALLRGTASETISAIGALDSELLLFLQLSRIIPEDVLARLEAERTQS
jgi:purine-binding chemotaxis protein CheW